MGMLILLVERPKEQLPGAFSAEGMEGRRRTEAAEQMTNFRTQNKKRDNLRSALTFEFVTCLRKKNVVKIASRFVRQGT